MLALAARVADPFAEARAELDGLEAFLGSPEACNMTHSDLERELEKRGRELMRQLLQAPLQVRGQGEAAEPVQGSDGVVRDEPRLHERGLETIFGEVRVERAGYGAEGVDSLHPLDAKLNLPVEVYSHEVRRRAAEAAAQGSFNEVVHGLSQTTGAQVAKRQVEELVVRAAQDFQAFYHQRYEWRSPQETGSILVLTVDGKGVVMRREDLREGTRKRAEECQHKLRTRLSRGEKRNAKRMATVAAVYTMAPQVRTAEQVLRCLAPRHERETLERPPPESKRVWASVQETPEEVIKEGFREARLRDPEGRKRWVALVDGNETQLQILRKLFRRYGYYPLIVLDFAHVAEYVWKAGMALLGEGQAQLDTWATDHLLGVLRGRSGQMAAGMRRSATRRGLAPETREAIDRCAHYLLKYARYLRYDEYLALGLPIATGVIEGACRYLVKDRMERTGARWSLKGAEAVLRLRALWASGDFEAYWAFHEKQEYLRNHAVRYADGQIVPMRGSPRPPLKRVK